MENIYDGPDRRKYERRALRDRRKVFKNPNFKASNKRRSNRRCMIDRRQDQGIIS